MQSFKAQKRHFWARGRLSCFSPKYVCWSWERYGLFPNLTTLTVLDYLGWKNNKKLPSVLYFLFHFKPSKLYVDILTASWTAEYLTMLLSSCGTCGMMLRNMPRAVCCGLHLQPGTKSEGCSSFQRTGWTEFINKRVEHCESKRGNCEGFEGSGFKDFSWHQLLAKLGHLSLTKKPVFWTKVVNNRLSVAASLLTSASHSWVWMPLISDYEPETFPWVCSSANRKQ